MDHIEDTFSSNSSVVVYGFIAVGTCLFAKAVLSNGCMYYLHIENLLSSSNGSLHGRNQRRALSEWNSFKITV